KDVHLDHLGERSLVLTVHLPVSGKARQRIDSRLLPGLVTPEFVRRTRTRTYKAHFPAQHVEQLRQLIQTGCPENAAPCDDAGITGVVQFRHWNIGVDQLIQMLLVRPGIDVHLHGSELQNKEALASKSDTLLAKKNRSRGRNLDP